MAKGKSTKFEAKPTEIAIATVVVEPVVPVVVVDPLEGLTETEKQIYTVNKIIKDNAEDHPNRPRWLEVLETLKAKAEAEKKQ